jgi:hypothetical protein
MADRDPGKEQPSLELPKLGLRRRHRRARETPPAPAPRPEPLVEGIRPIVVDQPEPAPTPAAEPQPRRNAPREREPGGMLAAVLTGAVVGSGVVGLTWAALRSCEGVQGTSSCGDAGYPLLGLLLVVMVVVGALLLRLLRVTDPTTTSFLGLGLGVVVLLVLADHLMDRGMVVVIPVLCAATYGLAHWVTGTFVEPPRD